MPSLNLPPTAIKEIFRIPVAGVNNGFEVETQQLVRTYVILISHTSNQEMRPTFLKEKGEQLAIALSTKCVKNTTVLLVKLKYHPPFMTAKVAPINGISTFLAASYSHHSSNPTFSFFHNLGQSVLSLIKKLTTVPCFSYEQDPFGNPGTNFSGCKVQFHNMGSERHTTKARSLYTRTPAKKSK